MDPLFWYGCRHDLNQSDLYAHPSEADSQKLHLDFDRSVASLSPAETFKHTVLFQILEARIGAQGPWKEATPLGCLGQKFQVEIPLARSHSLH